MRYLILSIIIIVTIAVVISLAMANRSSKKEARLVSSEEALNMMREMDFNHQPYYIVDVRDHGGYDDGHVPGAVNIPFDSIGKEEIALLPNKELPVFVYCRNGVRSRMAAEKLVNKGYTNVIDFGGIVDWPGDVVSTEYENGMRTGCAV